MRRLQSYSARGITVTFDPSLCIHSAICLRSLPAVFDVDRMRWIRPEAATIQEVVDTVRRCPSGALQTILEGFASNDDADEPRDGKTVICASRNGPLLVEGRFELVDGSGSPIAAAGRAALCRCGGTKNQPFCDGSHQARGFTSRRPAGD